MNNYHFRAFIFCIIFITFHSNSFAQWDELSRFYTPGKHIIYEDSHHEYEFPVLEGFEESVNRIKTWYCYKGHIVGQTNDDYFFIFDEKTETYTKFSNDYEWNIAIKTQKLDPSIWTRWWIMEDAQEKLPSTLVLLVFVFIFFYKLWIIFLTPLFLYVFYKAVIIEKFKFTGTHVIILYTGFTLAELMITTYCTTTFVALALAVIYSSLIFLQLFLPNLSAAGKARRMSFGIIPGVILTSILLRWAIGLNSL